jgi:acyl-CoA thioesterase FadM
MDQRPQPTPRRSFRRFLPITTRWMDDDVYGHVNNAGLRVGRLGTSSVRAS